MSEHVEAPTPGTTVSPTSGPVADHEPILAALAQVRDPEIGVNVVDLGLVYAVETRGDEVDVEMTLTSPSCPAGPQILRDAVNAIERVDGVRKAHVKLVLDPPWTPDRMSEAARDELGIF